MTSSTLRRLLCLVLAVATVGAGSALAQPVPVQPAPPFFTPAPIPEFDPGFYEPPLASYVHKKPGDIIAARQVNLANLSVAPLNVDGWQVSYRSTNTRNEPVAAVTTLVKPRGVVPEPRKLVSLQVAEDSTARYCAASYAVQQWSIPGTITGQAVVPLEFLLAQAMLAQGWALSIPDYQGPNSAYGASPLHARLVLDGIRAAKNFSQLGVTEQSRIALTGYSGGAIATGHTAEAKASYAPELNIVGTAEGGVPADLRGVFENSNNQLTTGVVLGAVVGLTREYPDFKRFTEQHLTPLGRAIWDLKQPLCIQYHAAVLPFLNMKGLLGNAGPDVLNHPEVLKVFDQTRMGKSVPDHPVYIYHSNPDYLIPIGPVNTLVSEYCSRPNAQVRYERDHFSEHLTMQMFNSMRALNWLKERLDGVAAQPGCTTADLGSVTLDPATVQGFLATLPEVLQGLFGKALGAR